MNVEQVNAAVVEILNQADDPEAAGSLERDLYKRVLEAIANGTGDDAQACAKAALATQNIEFTRWDS